MAVFTYHLAMAPAGTTVSALCFPPKASGVPGLIHAECMACMTLGSAIFSSSRMRPRQLAVFAKWESEDAIDRFLARARLGAVLGGGWHVRLAFVRRWGHVDEFGGLPEAQEELGGDAPVVSVTLARMRLLQVPRFVRWGRPVEALVRDHPAITLATAAFGPPRTVSTFSVWKTQREMLEMVRGKSPVPGPGRHAAAMKERLRKDFHTQFTTLRFRPLSEHGLWEGRSGFIPAGATEPGLSRG